ncbi:hypothetical protein MC7420_798 [Coleofasciculus chthonoplastes PCC 7420]|uniref:Uncharacterized protein n=1 Tax=Coleofasciculus chthonoplastes PCC 7420 TaxID=118168 RepID=B4VTB5_9CYAN|nr:hypothetical protein MC7420_798 [Coleofasciculus chthonoplastes PCC 7420]
MCNQRDCQIVTKEAYTKEEYKGWLRRAGFIAQLLVLISISP